MSNLGKIVVVGVVGVVCYYSFVEKRNPLADWWENPIEEANKDYVEHRIKTEKELAEKNATVLQDTGAERAITKNQ
ncbi:hypothetical protein CCY99_04875 [Helicobacter sp. 16-1353]|uniref:hypothetical protein n=1 Tax=Helicobacter sp. 16-1353 TaxID=2004996 RepID=UPI000DCC041F|nr:hypothetical protein [Helicobacter sp. 16-1353]RAX54019.1 hypothetical protein CCY99_04875 [Helicobacter sp. 16-1353]